MIWGAGAGYFLNTTISPNTDDVSLTASKRATNTTAAGFVFDQCTVTPADGASYSEISLGRPWNAYARVAFIESYLGSCIESAGWEQWTKTDPRTSGVIFGEMGNYGPGSSTSGRASFATQLTASDAAQFELANFFAATTWINMTLVKATPFVAGSVTVPTASTTSVSSTSSSSSSSTWLSTATVYTTKISTIKETSSTTTTAADTTLTQRYTSTLDIGTTITPSPTTRVVVEKTSTTQISTVSEPDETVTKTSTLLVNVASTVTPDPTYKTSTVTEKSVQYSVKTTTGKTSTV